MRTPIGLLAFLMSCGALFLSPVATASIQPGTYFAGYYTNFYGTRYYQGYVPSTYNGTPMPLVVGLHGCTEYAAGFELLTGLDDLAEQRGFILVLPEQSSYANGSRCWNWFLSSNQSRGRGEPSIIAGITNWVRNHYAVNAKRIHVTGASAGAAMSVIMGATYPDLYASIGAHSGCEYKGVPCGSSGGPDPVSIGNQIYSAMGSYRRVLPVIAFVGSDDGVAAPINTEQIIVSFAQANDRISDGVDNDNIDGVPEQAIAGQVPGGRSYTRYVYKDSSNAQTVLEKYVVDGMGHAWSGGCGCSIYGDPDGPDASALMYDFFVAHPKP
jgi:poly(hydroxyalkanoate) depolymerase family esterase